MSTSGENANSAAVGVTDNGDSSAPPEAKAANGSAVKPEETASGKLQEAQPPLPSPNGTGRSQPPAFAGTHPGAPPPRGDAPARAPNPAGQEAAAGGRLPEQPPPPAPNGMDRRVSTIGRIFGTNDSITGLLASTDSATAAKLEGLFRSGASFELPPLSMESEAAVAAAAAAATREQSSSSGSGSEVNITDSFARELVKSEDPVIQKIMQSASRAAQAAVEAEKKPAAATAATAAATTAVKRESATNRRSGIFTSKDWGSSLGSIQDVDIGSVFQTSRENMEKLTAAAAAAAPNPGKTNPPPDRRPKKKRDWNALVMNDLEASIAKPQRPASNTTGATPADAQLFAAAAAGFGKSEGAKAAEAVVGTGNVPPKKRKSPPPLPSPEPSRQTPKSPKNASAAAAPLNKDFVEPTDDDVLLGRGGRSNNHPGNKKYLEVKDGMQARYMAADKNGKTPISQELVDVVKGWGGRFLKQDPATQKWYVVDNTTARKKASQTLREVNTPEERAAKRARYAK